MFLGRTVEIEEILYIYIYIQKKEKIYTEEGLHTYIEIESTKQNDKKNMTYHDNMTR